MNFFYRLWRDKVLELCRERVCNKLIDAMIFRIVLESFGTHSSEREGIWGGRVL